MYIVIVAGPTGCGKTEFASRICRECNGEIVSADSMQIYRGMDIGTAKADETETGGIRQNMIDVVEPTETYSAACYGRDAEECIRDIAARGKVPVVTGGTGLYINSLLYGMSFGGSAGSEEVRTSYEGKTTEELAQRLRTLDASAAEQIAATDRRRMIRALEIYELTGKTKTENAEKLQMQYETDAFFLTRPRAELYERVDRRVDLMMERGLVDEVAGLLARGVTREHQSMQAIGYKEIAAYLAEECDLATATENVKRATRHYVKRQETWFKRYEFFNRVDMTMGMDEAVDAAVARIRSRI